MSDTLRDAIIIIVAYLLGALPFSVWIARARGVDVRKVGSGNPGATNVMRAAGRGPGVLALACDIAKGVAAVAVARLLGAPPEWWGWAALAAVCGHVFSVFLRFRGGKGVATAAGALGAVSPASLLAAMVVFAATVALTRYVSLGSMLGALTFPIVLWFLADPALDRRARLALLASSSLIALLVVVRHRANLGRLLAGTENRLGGTKTA
jgi:acyl phosphate:glycerol-3-phosphate acyltransferase